MRRIILLILIALVFSHDLFAGNQTVNLIVDYKIVNFAGIERNALSINNQIPAPTLHFKQGDRITINVQNKLDKPTAIHWHGIILPWQMDGVEGVTQKGIMPGKTFTYEFTLEQSGTYWYHAHAGLQEQEGLYGAIIIDPSATEQNAANKDFVVVLSDWSNTPADQIFANLKKEGDYYSPNLPLQPSLVKFMHDYEKASNCEKKQIIDDYKMMQQMRMSLYDYSDVAYDAFLLNGHSRCKPWTEYVKVGDTVRLRFIGAGASTIFKVKIPGVKVQIIHVQGNDIKPYSVSDFSIAPGETYDVLVKIEKNQPYIIYAESLDTLGAAYGALLTATDQKVNLSHVKSFPEPQSVSREMMGMMMAELVEVPEVSRAQQMPMMDHSMHSMSADMDMRMDSNQHQHMAHQKSMQHSSSMEMPTEPSVYNDSIVSANEAAFTSTGTKYQNLIAAVATNDPAKPIKGEIKMELFGYMEQYIWFINGKPEYESMPYILEPGKRYRFVFTNNSMMHHPMHIHGHWFILRLGNGEYDPLLHTIDVAPGATITADIDADASGQWLFHCHMLYHMFSGMSRVFQYSTLLELTDDKVKPQDYIKQTSYTNRPIVRVDETRPIDSALVKHPMAHPMGLYFANFLDVGADPFNNAQKLTFKGLYGADYNKIELFINDAEMHKGRIDNADIDVFYWHLLSQFWVVKGGMNYFYRPAQTPYWQPGIGIEGMMPYFIETDLRVYYNRGGVKFDLELVRDTQLTNNFFLRLGLRGIFATKTVPRSLIGSGLNQMRYIVRPYYRLMPALNVFAEYEHEGDYGSFKRLLNQSGEASLQNTITFGLSFVF